MSASDDSKNTSFLRSRLPVEYRDRAFGLSALGEAGRPVLDWIQLDGLKKLSSRGVVLEVVGKSSLSRDVFYAIARAFILKSISVRCVHSTDLLKDNMTDELQPWQFGHPESKATCLWLKRLPALAPTDILPRPESGRWSNQTASGQNKLAPSANRWKIRSTTYQGIADAMAAQWM